MSEYMVLKVNQKEYEKLRKSSMSPWGFNPDEMTMVGKDRLLIRTYEGDIRDEYSEAREILGRDIEILEEGREEDEY